MKAILIHLKETLEKEKAILEEEVSGLGTLNPETNNWEATPEEIITPEADENDVADRHEGYEGRTAMLNTLGKKLHAVEDALVRIENGTYGTCEVCGEKIEEKRLEANPAAKTCMVHMNE